MHTYIKRGDGTYSIGQWLPDLDGITAFKSPLFDVVDLYAAIVMVNILNGGNGKMPNERILKMQITKEY